MHIRLTALPTAPGHLLDRYNSVRGALIEGNLSLDEAVDILVSALVYDHALGLPCGVLERQHSGKVTSGIRYRDMIRTCLNASTGH